MGDYDNIVQLIASNLIKAHKNELKHNAPFYEEIMKEPEVITNSRGGKQHKVEGRFDLIPAEPIEKVAIVLEGGAERYGKDNWRNIDINDHINHAIAHLFKYLSGDRSEDHLSNAICRTLFASELSDPISIIEKAPQIQDESDPGIPAKFSSLAYCYCAHHMGLHNRMILSMTNEIPEYQYTNCNICSCTAFKEQ